MYISFFLHSPNRLKKFNSYLSKLKENNILKLGIIHGISTLYNNYIMAACCLAKIQSRMKGHHVYNFAFKVSEILNYSIENDNEYSENAIAVFSSGSWSYS